MEPIDIIKNRRSIRTYDENLIPERIIEAILDCARLAPTARNKQPWLIGVVTDKQILDKMGKTCSTGPFIADSAACFTVFCKKDEKYYLEDGVSATMNIIHACEANGVKTCWVAGDKKPYVNEIARLLEVPDEYTLVSLIPAGYSQESAQPKNKKSINEISFRNNSKKK